MLYKYEITLRQQFLVLNTFLIIDGGATIAYLYFFGVHIPYPIFILPLSLLFILTVLPVLILHPQYYRANRNSEFIIDRTNQTLHYVSRSIDLKEKFSDIESVHFYGSYSGDSGIYTFSGYSYFKIILKNKHEIIITSLMMYDIKNKLPELLSVNAVKHYNFLATLKQSRYL